MPIKFSRSGIEGVTEPRSRAVVRFSDRDPEISPADLVMDDEFIGRSLATVGKTTDARTLHAILRSAAALGGRWNSVGIAAAGRLARLEGVAATDRKAPLARPRVAPRGEDRSLTARVKAAKIALYGDDAERDATRAHAREVKAAMRGAR